MLWLENRENDMAQAPIKIGIIGAGNNTACAISPDCSDRWRQLVSVCNRSSESSQRVADQFNIPSLRGLARAARRF